jgi:lipopolysaccharide transport system permease protein
MVAVIEGFRWCILRRGFVINWTALVLSLLTILTIAVSGFAYFRKTERSFADVI